VDTNGDGYISREEWNTVAAPATSQSYKPQSYKPQSYDPGRITQIEEDLYNLTHGRSMSRAHDANVNVVSQPPYLKRNPYEHHPPRAVSPPRATTPPRRGMYDVYDIPYEENAYDSYNASRQWRHHRHHHHHDYAPPAPAPSAAPNTYHPTGRGSSEWSAQARGQLEQNRFRRSLSRSPVDAVQLLRLRLLMRLPAQTGLDSTPQRRVCTSCE